jgi:O-antigen ligase
MAGATITIGGRRYGAPSASLIAALALTVVAGLLGGASRDARGFLIAVELVSLPVGALALRRIARSGLSWRTGVALGVVVLLLAIPLVQSAPLPAELWLKAPGQDARFAALVAAGADLGWRPLSLDPASTLAAITALFPPIAMFLVTLDLGPNERRWVAAGWIGLALGGLMLGLVQMTQVDGGWAYPYADTNTGSLVGWFANRNHEAAMLLALIAPAAVLAAGHGWTRWIGGGFLLLAVVAIGAVGSRAGIVLAAPVVVLTAAVLLRHRGWARRRWLVAAFLALTAVSVLTLALFAVTPILSRFGPDAGPEFRYRAWPLIWREASLHLPFGSGVGSFDRVYRAIEPLRFVGPKFFNHAHNDYLELWLETGWLGAVAFAAVTAWFVATTARAWSRRRGSSLARAAGVGVLALAAMSWVDYPLRTEAAACLFAFLLAATAPTGGQRRG